jgi:hypothetical protein
MRATPLLDSGLADLLAGCPGGWGRDGGRRRCLLGGLSACTAASGRLGQAAAGTPDAADEVLRPTGVRLGTVCNRQVPNRVSFAIVPNCKVWAAHCRFASHVDAVLHEERYACYMLVCKRY